MDRPERAPLFLGARIDHAPDLSLLALADVQRAVRRLRHAVGAGPEDLVVLDGEGFELIPRAEFLPLSRAAIRLALGGGGARSAQPGAAGGGRRP